MNSPLKYALNEFCDDNPEKYLTYTLQEAPDLFDTSTDTDIPVWLLFE